MSVNVESVKSGEDLAASWAIGGAVNGGFLSAVLLRAVGDVATLRTPASIYSQYLRRAQPGPCEITVSLVRSGSTSEVWDAVLSQDERMVVRSSVVVVARREAPNHLAEVFPDVPRPEALPSATTLVDETSYDLQLALWRELDERPVEWDPDWVARRAGVAEHRTWCSFRNWETSTSPFHDLGRALVVIDTFEVPAVLAAHDGADVSSFPRTLDLAVHFHAMAEIGRWLLCDARSPVAGHGLAFARAQLWDDGGQLVASASQDMVWR